MFTPLANISKGSPASLSNSTTEPSFNLSKSLIFISVEPTSTVSFTSIFSKTFRFSIPALLDVVEVSCVVASFSAILILLVKVYLLD